MLRRKSKKWHNHRVELQFDDHDGKGQNGKSPGQLDPDAATSRRFALVAAGQHRRLILQWRVHDELSGLDRLGGHDIAISTDGNDEPSTELVLADVEAGVAALRNSGTFAAEAWRETRATNVASDEGVCDDVDGANAAHVARVDAAVATGGHGQATKRDLVDTGIS